MKIELLDEAQEDLIEGFRFYETREVGLGSSAPSRDVTQQYFHRIV